MMKKGNLMLKHRLKPRNDMKEDNLIPRHRLKPQMDEGG